MLRLFVVLRLFSVVMLCLVPLFGLQCGSYNGNTNGSDKGIPGKAVDEGVTASFVTFGDWGEGSQTQRQVARAIDRYCLTTSCEFILTLGDNFYDRGVQSINDSQWQEKYRDIYDFLGIPFYAVLGNHDAYGNVQAQIDYSSVVPFWNMPAENYTFCWPEQKRPCIVEFFVFYSSNFNQTVADWLEDALIQSDSRWKILAMHHPLYSNAVDSKNMGNDSLGKNESILQVICDRIDLVFSAHVHAFSYLQTDEDGCLVNQLIIGTGGHSELHAVREAANDPRVLATGKLHGFGWFQVTQNKITFQMVDTDGKVFYSSSWIKSSTNRPVLQDVSILAEFPAP